MRETITSRLAGQLWSVRFEDRLACEIGFSRDDTPHDVGAICRARILEELSDLDGQLVDLGEGHGLLPYRGHECDRPQRGASVVVEVDRAARGGRLPRVNTAPRHVGPHLIYLPAGDGVALARSMTDQTDRDRLRHLLEEVSGKIRGGWMIRSAAVDSDEAAMLAEARALHESWHDEVGAGTRSGLLRAATPLVGRLLRDLSGEESLVVDDPHDATVARREAARWGGAQLDRLRLLSAPRASFVRHGFSAIVRQALAPVVVLDNGMRMDIEPTEALVAIDLNGRSANQALQIEAVKELARQLRLRDLSGAIVVDLIGHTDRDGKIEQAFRNALASHKRRTRVLGVDAIGLLRATRERRVRAWWDQDPESTSGYWRTHDEQRREVGRDLLDSAEALIALEDRCQETQALTLTTAPAIHRQIERALQSATESTRRRLLQHPRRIRTTRERRPPFRIETAAGEP